jgi:hypothetical protein
MGVSSSFPRNSPFVLTIPIIKEILCCKLRCCPTSRNPWILDDTLDDGELQAGGYARHTGLDGYGATQEHLEGLREVGVRRCGEPIQRSHTEMIARTMAKNTPSTIIFIWPNLIPDLDDEAARTVGKTAQVLDTLALRMGMSRSEKLVE